MLPRQVLVDRSCGETPTAAAPLDGSAAPDAGSTTSATFGAVVFPAGGLYRLCFAVSASATYELLDPTIVVAGCARRCTDRGMGFVLSRLEFSSPLPPRSFLQSSERRTEAFY